MEESVGGYLCDPGAGKAILTSTWENKTSSKNDVFSNIKLKMTLSQKALQSEQILTKLWGWGCSSVERVLT